MIEQASGGKPLTKRRLMLIAGGIALVGGVICLLLSWLVVAPHLRFLGWLAIVIGAAWLALSRFANTDPMRAHYRRYLLEFFPAIAAYMLVMVLVWPLLDHAHGTLVRTVIALAPVVPMIFVVRGFVRMVMRSDELEQRLHLIGLAVASALVVLATMTGGFLAAADVVPLRGKALLWVFPLMMTSYGLAHWWAARHYGVKGGCP